MSRRRQFHQISSCLLSLLALAFVPICVHGAEATTVSFRVEADKSTVSVGEEIKVSVFAQDTRPDSQGIFSAYLDLNYQLVLLELDPSSIEHGAAFGEAPSADTSTPGVVGEVGSLASGGVPAGSPGESLLVSFLLRAIAPGTATITSDAADLLPLHATTLDGFNGGVPPVAMLFGSATINIIPEPAGGTLMALALLAAVRLRRTSGRRAARMA
jgi:hypothetical protein